MNSYTVHIFKADKRTKSGRRPFKTFVHQVQDDAVMATVANMLQSFSYPERKGFTVEWYPATKIVKNLMTGQDVEIAYDTPRCCDPSSESYWTM